VTRPIFEDPPDDMAKRVGALVINWNGNAGTSAPEVRDAFHVAAETLLDAAIAHGETWEAVYPILYCYRHALELALKAALPSGGKTHSLPALWDAARPHVTVRLPAEDVAWLGERIAEFIHADPASTAFRYHDAVPDKRETEPWVDFPHLRATMARVRDVLARAEAEQAVEAVA
jgi:hypothetical protein